MSDMLFIIQDYLRNLHERDELDALLPDLLRSMSMQVVKLAFKGEVEHGVDLAAFQADKDSGTLYLFQVKSGDIDQQLWDSGPNSVRSTLNNLLDVPFKDLSRSQLQKAKKIVVLVHNGTLRENIREKFNGYVEKSFQNDLGFERWDLDHLSILLEENLLNERIISREYQQYLKRTIVFINIPDYDFIDFKHLLEKALPQQNKLTKKNRDRLFGFLRLVIGIIQKHCQDENLLSKAIDLYEYSLLYVWGWINSNQLLDKKIHLEFWQIYVRYIFLLIEWTDYLEPVLILPYGLFWNGVEEKVEYPLRTYKVISTLGILIIALVHFPEYPTKKEDIARIGELLAKVIKNNPSSNRPLIDNQLIDIFIGLWGLLYARYVNTAKKWVGDIFDNIAIRKQVKHRLPELYNNIDAVIEFESTDERPIEYQDSSSTLIYFLFEICLILGLENLYTKYQPIFKDVNFQVWYPPENIEDIFYFREVHEGDTEIINHLPESFEEFLKEVEARHSFDKSNYSPLNYHLPALMLIANKYYRTPVFPFWWRDEFFKMINQNSQTSSNL